MSRTIIDIPNALLHEADDLSLQLGISRAELVRRALREFLQGQQPVKADGFALWAEKVVLPKGGAADEPVGAPRRRRGA